MLFSVILRPLDFLVIKNCVILMHLISFYFKVNKRSSILGLSRKNKMLNYTFIKIQDCSENYSRSCLSKTIILLTPFKSTQIGKDKRKSLTYNAPNTDRLRSRCQHKKKYSIVLGNAPVWYTGAEEEERTLHSTSYAIIYHDYIRDNPKLPRNATAICILAY